MTTRRAHPTGALLFALLFIAWGHHASAAPGLCEVATSNQSNLILDIEESRGTQVSQSTTPEELPVVGDPFSGEVGLSLTFPRGKAIFALNGKRLQLLQPLDRDADSISHIVFQLSCTVRATQKRRSIPVIVRVSDVNDNAPQFIGTPYHTTVSELTPVASTVFRGINATDADAGVNGLVEYAVVPGVDVTETQSSDSQDSARKNGPVEKIKVADGYGFFVINLPHQGQITVNRSLDYERAQRYLVTVVASDRARNSSERFSSTTTLTIDVKDEDDQEPMFAHQGCALTDGVCTNPEYTASVSSGILAGVLNINPVRIRAVDRDSINSPIEYTFLSGMPSTYKDYFEINPQSGAVKQIRPVDTSIAKKFELIIKAEEISESKRFATAKLIITVKPVDSHPPEIVPTAIEGLVNENAPIGTKVLDKDGNPIVLKVVDVDLRDDDPKPSYSFELTTNYFKIENDGTLVVNEENLDRDPPSPGKFRFQVVAREVGGNAASAPLPLTVVLNDVNDNTPILPLIPPITVQAGEGKRDVIKVSATDKDLGDNAEITYSIYHVSNNGRQKFKIDPVTGVIEASGKLNADEQYSITVQATDKGGKYSQTIVEITVIPGPNTRSPVFTQSIYEVQVSEGASINSTVVTIMAIDPENDPVTYSIVSGNDLWQFAIGDKTGIITVIRKLDREELTRYQLLVKAEDTGGLSSTATINIRVTDINDKNPEFVKQPYEFRIIESNEVNRFVGKVEALDADEGQNAEVYYSLPDDVPFSIEETTGIVRTKSALDFETEREYRFVVTAKDRAPDPRIATATVTVEVVDIDDEVPYFHSLSYDSSVPENVPDYMVTQVKAEDPDTNQKITFVIKQGPTDLFQIDSKTGVIRTTRGLDYERETQYILIVGTLENSDTMPGATTKVIVNVEDRNDIPPVFTMLPKPITLEDDVPIGKTVMTLLATDSDGTPPGNKVRYELVGKGKASRFFQIDPNQGIIQIRDDLRKDTSNEYQIDVKAYDLGEPQLWSITTVPVYVKHIATVPPETGLGFVDDSYTVSVPENITKPGSLLKVLTVLNARAHDLVPLACKIVKGNENGLFDAKTTSEKSCELRLNNGHLDHEEKDEYQLQLELETLTGLVNPARSKTNVKVQVIDVNDNVPEFTFSDHLNGDLGKYFGALSSDSQIHTSILQVQAEDKDSGKYGKIEYKIVPNGPATEYFTIGNSSGIIRSKRSLDDLNPNIVPFRFSVEARDNPASTVETNAAQVPVVINLIEEQHRMILVIEDAPPEVVKNKENIVLSILKDHSKMAVGVEKVVARQYLAENNTIESDSSGTDIWFYVIDPETERILERNSSRVQRSILDKESISNITFELSGNLKATASGIHGPLMVQRTKAAILVSWDVFPYALIVIACIILVLGIVGIMYICVSWTRYKTYKERMQRLYVVPRFDPVFVEPNLKEYETQVLQMSVPLDDSDSYNDLQLDFSSKNHAFSLDNVSYITKANGGQQSPVSSDAATTARASSIVGGTGGGVPTDGSNGNTTDVGSKSNLMGHLMMKDMVT
ncbi:cadherin-99C isoform X2 [Hetaerina americana]|uniref:cadherin-99C isoform X2 n=1 Tax=Hetaerina americana TaxID=62018 RepID=UPI003A7F220B